MHREYNLPDILSIVGTNSRTKKQHAKKEVTGTVYWLYSQQQYIHAYNKFMHTIKGVNYHTCNDQVITVKQKCISNIYHLFPSPFLCWFQLQTIQHFCQNGFETQIVSVSFLFHFLLCQVTFFFPWYNFRPGKNVLLGWH